MRIKFSHRRFIISVDSKSEPKCHCFYSSWASIQMQQKREHSNNFCLLYMVLVKARTGSRRTKFLVFRAITCFYGSRVWVSDAGSTLTGSLSCHANLNIKTCQELFSTISDLLFICVNGNWYAGSSVEVKYWETFAVRIMEYTEIPASAECNLWRPYELLEQ